MRKPTRLFALGLLLFISLPMLSAAEPPSEIYGTATREAPWHDTFTAHVEALALLQTLNADLLSHESATLTLEGWCQEHHMASPARVVAERLRKTNKPPTALQREELGISASEQVRYRRVRLRCGDHVLSEAENWYVPGRLTPDMNRLLESTDTPFGRVVQPLHFWRHLLEARLLWSPLPAGWESASKSTTLHSSGPWPDARSAVLQHRAVLVLPDGHPISEVIETYTGAVLAFPEPHTGR